MAISSTLVSDPLTTATTQSLFTFAPTAWAALTATSGINIGATGVSWASGAGSYNGAVRIDTTFPNDQWVQSTLVSLAANPGYFGLALRTSTASGGSGYLLEFSNSQWQSSKIVSGTGTALITGTITFAANDVILFQVVGTTLKFWRNGVLMWEYVDSSIASGAPGLACNGAASTVLKTWSAGAAVADQLMLPMQAPPGGSVSIPSLAGNFTANTWKVGLSVNTDPQGTIGPPPNITTGLILSWSSASATTIRVGARANGSAYATQPTAGTETTGANQQGVIFCPVKLVAGTPQTAQFDLILNSAGAGFFCTAIGWFGPETVWFEPPLLFQPTGTMTPAAPAQFQWTGLSTPTPIPSNALAVICDIWGVNAELLPSVAGTGEITKWLPSGGICHSVICGMGSGWAYFTADNSSIAPSILVRGYMKAGITWENTAYDVSPTTAGTQIVNLSPAASPNNPNMVLYQMRSASNVILASNWGGSISPAASYENGQAMAVAPPPVKMNLSATPLTMGEQAYFVGVAPTTATVAPSLAKGIITIRSTSQAG